MGDCHKGKSHCVADVLRVIADRQDDVEDQNCNVSCMRSIQDLVSPTITNNLNTVPFILYSKDNTPFAGYGARLVSNGVAPVLDCVSTFFFRVSEVSEDDSCAVLELLLIDDGDVTTPPPPPVDPIETPCDQLPDGTPLANFERTGVCITVDLDCFCGISCLPPASLPPATTPPTVPPAP